MLCIAFRFRSSVREFLAVGLPTPVGESTKQCCRAYNQFVADNPEYDIDVKLCAFTLTEMVSAKVVFEGFKR